MRPLQRHHPTMPAADCRGWCAARRRTRAIRLPEEISCRKACPAACKRSLGSEGGAGSAPRGVIPVRGGNNLSSGCDAFVSGTRSRDRSHPPRCSGDDISSRAITEEAELAQTGNTRKSGKVAAADVEIRVEDASVRRFGLGQSKRSGFAKTHQSNTRGGERLVSVREKRS